MDDTPPPIQKKGLGVLAWLGIGCGGIIVLGIIGVVAFTMMFGGNIKGFFEDFEKDPTQALATMTVNVSFGAIEMVAEDKENKRYTVRTKKTGELKTIYWNEKKKAPDTVLGDFSAIPAASSTPDAPAPSEPAPAPSAPAPAGEIVPDKK